MGRWQAAEGKTLTMYNYQPLHVHLLELEAWAWGRVRDHDISRAQNRGPQA